MKMFPFGDPLRQIHIHISQERFLNGKHSYKSSHTANTVNILCLCLIDKEDEEEGDAIYFGFFHRGHSR